MAAAVLKKEFSSELVPGPVEYAVLLPEGYEQSDETYPLLYFLHGGGGDRSFLELMRPVIERTISSGKLPKVVAVTPSVSRSLYMDYRDGSQKWEQFLIGPFMDHLRREYRLIPDRRGTLLFGISMGGMGALRMGFKYPDLFTALAALEPGIEPALAFGDIQPEDRFWRPDELFEAVYGKPVDEAYWAMNNPANIALKNREKIIQSRLGIYLECGDEDSFGLDRGTEFLHRLLRDHRISHEYHLVKGADHLGRSLGPRSEEGLAFLGRMLNPPPPGPEVENLRRMIAQWKQMWKDQKGLEIS
jgi:S-formylglutathione hydrolase